MESNGRERTSLQSYEERQSDCSQSCSDASDSGSRPDSTQSQKRVTPQSFDQTAIKKQNMLDSTPSFPMPGCPSAPFPTFSSSPLIISPTMFKPIISSVVNQGRPLNLSMANATVDSVGFAPQQSSNQCYSGSSLSNQSELMTSNQIIRNAIKRPSPGLLCVVCGDTSSGKHYGILACNGCSGFFKRSVRRKLIYRCQAGTGNCVIDKQHRNQCQSCRLKKCISMGMNKDAVQNERQPRNTGIRSIANTRCSTLGFPQQNQLPSDMRNSININRSGEESLEDNAKELERNRISAHFDYNNSGNYHVNVSNPVGALSSFGYSASADQAFNAMIHCHSESIYETSARLLFMAVKWAKNLPSFANLTFRDQVILLEESWAEIFLLSAIQWCLPLEKCPMFSIANIPEGSDHSADIRVLSDALNRFRSTSVDPAEFACLKALALFKPEARGLKDVTRIEHMQDQAQLMLLQHVKAHNPTNPTRYTYGKAVVRYV